MSRRKKKPGQVYLEHPHRRLFSVRTRERWRRRHGNEQQTRRLQWTAAVTTQPVISAFSSIHTHRQAELQLQRKVVKNGATTVSRINFSGYVGNATSW